MFYIFKHFLVLYCIIFTPLNLGDVNFYNIVSSGLKTTKNLIQQRFAWHGMNKDIANWVKSCPNCQKGKVLRHNKTPLQKLDLPSERFSHVHMNIVGPMLSPNGYRYLFTAVERFSKWFTATPMKEITAEAAAGAC